MGVWRWRGCILRFFNFLRGFEKWGVYDGVDGRRARKIVWMYYFVALLWRLVLAALHNC